ncbi:MAG: STAS domain-containing protein [Dissulfurispiraceae bacterium]|jgi:anti-anti-sigma regulatory factor
MSFNFEQFNDIGILKLYGDFTSRNAAIIIKAFFVGLGNSEHLIMDFRYVSKIDDFFVDQIFSLKKISRRSSKKLTIINLHPAIYEKHAEQSQRQEQYQAKVSSLLEM